MRNVSICGATETLLIHKDCPKKEINLILNELKNNNCLIYADNKVRKIFSGKLKKATNKDWRKEYLDSKIYYGGHVDDIRSEIINSSAVVLPSYREGFSKVLMEAQACSRPVITSNVPGCRDAIIENLTGYLIEPKNSDELAEKIILMIENPIQFQAMSRNAYKHAKNCFSVDGAVLKHLDIFKKVTSI